MLSVFSVLAALLSCGDLVRQSGIVSLPPDSAPTSTSSTATSLAEVIENESDASFWFGERWQYTLTVQVVQISQCVLTFDGPASFHCSPVNGTHAEVVFHPVDVGDLSAKLVLPGREILLEGVGLSNPFRPPKLSFELPRDVTFEPWVYLHNPLSTPVRLKEVYMTNSMFSVQVPPGTSWTIPAHTTRPVARVSVGLERRFEISYLRVRSFNDDLSLYLPLRLSPVNAVEPTPSGLFFPEQNLDIGPVFVTSAPQTVPLNVVNTSPKSVVVLGSSDSDGLRLVTPEKPVGAGKTCTVKVALEPERLSKGSGKLLLKSGKFKLQVPYTIQLLNGSLQAANSLFYIGAKGKRAFSVEVKNQVNSGLRIDRILVGSKEIDPPATRVVAKNASVQIDFPAPAKNSKSFNSTMRVLTNVTEFVYDLVFYSGKLDMLFENKPVTDRVDFGNLGIKQRKEFTLDFYNANPLQIQMDFVASNLSSAVFALPSLPPWILVPYGSLQVTLTVGSPTEGQVWGNIVAKTDHAVQVWLCGFQASKGTVTAAGMSSSRLISVEGAFPFRSSAEPVYLESTFDEPLVVTRARVKDERFHMVLVDSPVLHPGAKSLLGTLKYQPVCTQCYVGLGGPLESSTTKDLFLWREMQERLKEAKSVNATLVVDTQQMRGFVIPITVSHVWPRVTARGAVRFDTIQLGNASYNPVIVDNPSDQPLMVQAYISTIGGPEINAIVGAQHSMKLPSHLSTAFSIERSVQYNLLMIPPKSKKRIMVRFEPTTIGSHVGVLVVRNNLTAVSSVILKGEGGIGKLLLAGQEPGGTIVFDINASLLKDCLSLGVYSTLKKYPVAKNVGHLPIRIRKVLINNQPCVGYGFRVRECDVDDSGFTIKPNASHRIEMSFTPDFTVSRVEVTLTLVLEESTLDFNLVVTLPKSSVSACANQQVRPVWEGIFYALCLVGSLLMVSCTVGFAFLESNRVLQETLFEARSRYERREMSLLERMFRTVTHFIPRSFYDTDEDEHVDHTTSVATQTVMEETANERKNSAHKENRGPSNARRRDSGTSSVPNGSAGRRDLRRRKIKDVSAETVTERHQQETVSQSTYVSQSEPAEVEENDLDKASEPEEREGSNTSLTYEVEATITKETDDEDEAEDVGQEVETASEDSSECSAEIPSAVVEKSRTEVKSKSQRRAEKKERQRRSWQDSLRTSTSANQKESRAASDPSARTPPSETVDSHKKSTYAEVLVSQLEKQDRNKKPEARQCPSRSKKLQKSVAQQETAVTGDRTDNNNHIGDSTNGGDDVTPTAPNRSPDSKIPSNLHGSGKNPRNNTSPNSTANGHCVSGSDAGELSAKSSSSPSPTSNNIKSQLNTTPESKAPSLGKSTNVASSSESASSPASVVATPARRDQTVQSKVTPNGASGSSPTSTATSSFPSAFLWPSFTNSSPKSSDRDPNSSNSPNSGNSSSAVPFPMAWTKPIYSFSSAVISNTASRVTTTLASGLSPSSRCSADKEVHAFLGTTASTRTTGSTVSSTQASDVESDGNSPKPDEQQEFEDDGVGEEEETLKFDANKLYIEDEDPTFGVVEDGKRPPKSRRSLPLFSNLLGSDLIGEARDELTGSKIENSTANNAETSDLSRSNSSAGHSSVSNVSCRSIASSSPSSDVVVANSDPSKSSISGFGAGGNLAANAIISSMKNNNATLNNIGGVDGNNVPTANAAQAASNFENSTYAENSLCNSINSILNNLNSENNMDSIKDFGSNTFMTSSYRPQNAASVNPTDSRACCAFSGDLRQNIPQQHLQHQQQARSRGSVNIITDLSTPPPGGKFNKSESNKGLAVKNNHNNNINKNTNSDKNMKHSQQPNKMGIITDICGTGPSSAASKLGNAGFLGDHGGGPASAQANISYSAVVSGGIGTNANNHDSSMNSRSNFGQNINSNKNLNSKSIQSVNESNRSKSHIGAARRGNPPPGFGLSPYGSNPSAPITQTASASMSYMMGFGNMNADRSFGRLQSMHGAAASSSASSSTSTTTLSSKTSGIGTDQSEEQEMAPLIRSIIDSVIPSSDRDDRGSMHWAPSNQSSSSNASGNASRSSSSPACQVWGAESPWMGNSSSSATVAAAAPPSTVYPVFLRRTPDRDPERERREREFDQQQRRAWNQQQPSSQQQHLHQHPSAVQQQHQPRQQQEQPQQVPQSQHLHASSQLNPPTMSPTNDYSYTGTGVWTTTQPGSTEPPVFPSPIGTPWTPFQSQALSLPALRALGLNRGMKKNQ
ncbi:transmembrane protein 131 [Galendromus occidentalis]|uniref:Transmembrane protein 131 n=1 Tax=Galendromus occidentalis TaxID=34638 RepID=A0AAJ7SIA2_9ACAR|nr:transmembrane protein 131 [Galendromus occidentalis]